MSHGYRNLTFDVRSSEGSRWGRGEQDCRWRAAISVIPARMFRWRVLGRVP